MALRVFPVPPREDRGGVSLRFVYDSRYRHARGPNACQEDGSSDASGGKERRKQRAPDPAAHRKQRRPWSWKAGEQADRGVRRYLLVFVLAVGGETVIPEDCQGHRTVEAGAWGAVPLSCFAYNAFLRFGNENRTAQQS